MSMVWFLFITSVCTCFCFSFASLQALLKDSETKFFHRNQTAIRKAKHFEEVGVCKRNPCLHNGRCVVDDNYVDGYFCECEDNYAGVKCQRLRCKLSLIKYASMKCLIKRLQDHKQRRKLFSLNSNSHGMNLISVPQMFVKSQKTFIKDASTSSFTIDWYMKMQDTFNENANAHAHFTLQDKKFHEQPTLKDLSEIYGYFYKQHKTKSAMSVLNQSPSIEANFYKDRSFVDQRFAGANVWQIYRVTNINDGRGLSWDYLQNKLNKHFNWNDAINTALGTSFEQAIEWAIENNKLFVSWYPELEGVNLNKLQQKSKGLTNHTVVRFTAPIAMFVMKGNGNSEDIETVAIQADAVPEARVFVPADDEEWFFAKSLVQRADFNVLQIVHKRLKCSLYMEPFCLLMERTFSEFHPLYDMLQYHCRAGLETNKLFDMRLYGSKGPLYNILSVDHPTSINIINKNFNELTMDNIDLEADMERRGMSDANIIPYYPYRDDGRLITASIRTFISGFVDMYYHDNSDVLDDTELQKWADAVSSDGNPRASSRGLVKKFPSKFTDKRTVKDVLSKLLWLATGYHASVTFPQLEYGGFLPNAPYRLFSDNEDNDVFSTSMLGNKVRALDQIEFTSNIASTHLDKLFDYGSKLQDKEAREYMDRFVETNLVMVTKKMAFANAIRMKSGHLPYPYLLPDFITNSIST